jgi:hypothetical protein
MRCPSWTPSIVPDDNDQTVLLVADDFGKPGRAWAQTGYERTDRTCLQANTAIRSG